MPYFNQKQDPSCLLTLLMDLYSKVDSHNVFTTGLPTLTMEKSLPRQLHTESTSVPSYIFAQTEFPPIIIGSYLFGPLLWILSTSPLDWLNGKIGL